MRQLCRSKFVRRYGGELIEKAVEESIAATAENTLEKTEEKLPKIRRKSSPGVVGRARSSEKTRQDRAKVRTSSPTHNF